MTTTATDSRSTVLRFVAALQNGDETTIHDCLAEDATWTMPGDHPAAGTYVGRAAILAQFLPTILSRLVAGSATFEVRGIIAEGHRAVVEWGLRARSTTGRAYANDYLVLFVLRDGQITAVREYTDTQRVAGVLFG